MRRKSDTRENWKNAHTKGYVISLILGEGGGRAPLTKGRGGQGPPGPPGSYSTGLDSVVHVSGLMMPCVSEGVVRSCKYYELDR